MFIDFSCLERVSFFSDKHERRLSDDFPPGRMEFTFPLNYNVGNFGSFALPTVSKNVKIKVTSQCKTHQWLSLIGVNSMAHHYGNV